MAKKKLAKKSAAKKSAKKPAAKKSAKKSSPKKSAKKAGKKTAPKKGSAKKATAKKATKSSKKPMKMTASPQSARAGAKASAKKSAPRAKKPVHAVPTMAHSEPAPSPGFTLSPGEAAPDFNLRNENGEMIHLSALRGKKIVLYFYPKDDTPGCTQESCDFRDNFGRLSPIGVVVLGVSKDSADSHLKFKNKYSLPFSLLSDEDGAICEAYGVWKEKNNYGKTYMGIERTTFVIDENGVIQHVYPKVNVAGHVDEVLAAVSGGH
jgi:peroxiredoxin Q/BCP